MIIDNLKGRCVEAVARELARPKFRGNAELRYAEWFETVRAQYPAAAEKINAMSNMELLDLVADVLAGD